MAKRTPASKAPTSSNKSPASHPGDADLAALLGRAVTHWSAFLSGLAAITPAAAPEWKHYAGKTGWRCIIRDKRRNLAYLAPMDGRFLVSMAFSDSAVAAAENSDLPREVVDPIRASPKFPEGRAVRIEVVGPKDVALALRLLKIKSAN